MKNGDDNPSGAKKALSPTGEGFYNAKKEEPLKRDSSLLNGTVLLLNRYVDNMRLCAVVPVKECFHINDVALLETFNSLVNICVGAAEIGFHNEGDVRAV